jgi:hypothetical protein
MEQKVTEKKLWLLKVVGPKLVEEFIVMAESEAAATKTFNDGWQTRRKCFLHVTLITGPVYYRRDYAVAPQEVQS